MYFTEFLSFWTKEIFHEALRDVCIQPRKVLCLGLGSPSSSRDARAQLALLSYLCASLDVVRGSRNRLWLVSSEESRATGHRRCFRV